MVTTKLTRQRCGDFRYNTIILAKGKVFDDRIIHVKKFIPVFKGFQFCKKDARGQILWMTFGKFLSKIFSKYFLKNYFDILDKDRFHRASLNLEHYLWQDYPTNIPLYLEGGYEYYLRQKVKIIEKKYRTNED